MFLIAVCKSLTLRGPILLLSQKYFNANVAALNHSIIYSRLHRYDVIGQDYFTDIQSQKTVSTYSTSKHVLPFDFVG